MRLGRVIVWDIVWFELSLSSMLEDLELKKYTYCKLKKIKMDFETLTLPYFYKNNLTFYILNLTYSNSCKNIMENIFSKIQNGVPSFKFCSNSIYG
jgi:hypothetical protein